MHFTPKKSKFYSYESGDYPASPITPSLFTQIIKHRSITTSQGSVPAGGTAVTDYFIDQIDMTEPNAFTLCMLEFSQWHIVMDELT